VLERGVRIATVFLVSTFLDDGIREIRSFHSQCEYLDTPANNFRLPHSVAVVYVLLSLTAQLVGGGYVLLCAFCSPNALTIPAIAGDTGWRFLRLAVTSLAAFVLSSINVYGIGQPASQHAQGRLVFLLRNGSMLGGVLLLIAAQQSSGWSRASSWRCTASRSHRPSRSQSSRSSTLPASRSPGC